LSAYVRVHTASTLSDVPAEWNVILELMQRVISSDFAPISTQLSDLEMGGGFLYIEICLCARCYPLSGETSRDAHYLRIHTYQPAFVWNVVVLYGKNGDLHML
jgi:hypothetical protein